MNTRVTHDPDPGELLDLYASHWWFDGRDPDDVRRSIEGSDAVAGLRTADDDRLVASARVITDHVHTAKVLDVVVDEPLRGRGLGTELMAAVVDHPELRGVDELTLNCRAGVAPFYEACGFEVHEMIREDGGEDYYVMVYER